MRETWRMIAGYDGLYRVSNMGNVRSIRGHTPKILSTFRNNYGYIAVCLCKNGTKKNHLIHRLVAETFIENPNNFPEINHINHLPFDNTVSNLEWCDHKYNMNHRRRNND
jgi:hypothetical protein